MQFTDILQFVQHKPFRPFRLTLTDGRTYEVHHPELAMVGLSVMVIGVPAPNLTDPVFQRAVTVDLEHLMEAEHLSAAAAPAKN